jgi:hypothetical protein
VVTYGTYDYDRRTAATFQAEAAFRIEGDEAIVSFLVGGWIAAYRRSTAGSPEENVQAELATLRTRLESLSGPEEEGVWDQATDLLEKAGFRFSTNLNDRDRDLGRKRKEYQQEAQKVLAKRLGKWMREYVVRFVDDIFAAYKRGNFSKEPCVTASYFRMMLLEGGSGRDEGFDEFRELFKDLDSGKQLAACQYALESAHKAGKINHSLGPSGGRREVKCYEPRNL